MPGVPIPVSWPGWASGYCMNMRFGELVRPWFCCLAYAHESAENEEGDEEEGKRTLRFGCG